MTLSEAQSLGASKEGAGHRGWGGDRARSTLGVNSSLAETSPIGLPAAWQTRRQGEGARGGYVWVGVWFQLLCLANSLERRRFTAPGTGTLVRQDERGKVFIFCFHFS